MAKVVETEMKESTGTAQDADDIDSKSFLQQIGIKVHPVAMPTDRHSHMYNMNHKERGRALIFNHKHFASKSLNSRHGTDEDKVRLRDTLTALGFHVDVFEDPRKMQIFGEIKKLAEEDHSNRDCIVIAVFSHGEKEKLHSYDDEYNPDRLWEPFDAKSCPSLAGKPKIFLFQACQGDKLDCGVAMVDQVDSKRTSTDAGGRSQKEYTIPSKADFIMVYSTFPGYYSWRNTTQGSWFIQALCKVLKDHAHQKDFLSMLTIVAREVAFDYASNHPDPNMDGKKQIPLVTSTLTREIFLTKKPKE